MGPFISETAGELEGAGFAVVHYPDWDSVRMHLLFGDKVCMMVPDIASWELPSFPIRHRVYVRVINARAFSEHMAAWYRLFPGGRDYIPGGSYE